MIPQLHYSEFELIFNFIRDNIYKMVYADLEFQNEFSKYKSVNYKDGKHFGY